MKKLTHSAAARAVAFILCLLCGLTALLCAAGYYMTRIDRDRTLPEPDSVSVYQNGIRVLLNNALQEERYTGEYPELPSGYRCHAKHTSSALIQISHDISCVIIRNCNFQGCDWFKKYRRCLQESFPE